MRAIPLPGAFLGAMLLSTVPSLAQQPPLAQRIGHYVPNTRPLTKNAHQGTGTLSLMNVIDTHLLTGNWQFVQRGYLDPHSSIGEHFHYSTEEMFVILDGEAEFTVDGRTALIKGPAAVPVRLEHAHGIYNPTNKPVQWMNFSAYKYLGNGSVEIGDDVSHAKLDAIPQFPSARFDRSELQPVQNFLGGKGTVQYRRLFGPMIYATNWAYMDHLLVPAGSTVGPVSRKDISEVYYVLSGAGKVTVGKETADIKAEDAVPIDINQTFSIRQTGSQPLEILVMGVAKDAAIKEKMLNVPSPPRQQTAAAIPAPNAPSSVAKK